MKKFTDNLRVRLVFLDLLSVIPALIISYWSSLEQRSLERQRGAEEDFRYTRLLSNRLDTLAESAQRLLGFIALQPEILDPQSCPAFLLVLQQIYTLYNAMHVAGLDGEILCSSLPEVVGESIGDHASFQQALNDKRYAPGEIIASPVAGGTVLTFAMPVLDQNGEVIAVLTAALNMEHLLSFSQEINLPPQSAMLLVDQQGTVLLCYPGSETWTGQSLPNVPVVGAMFADRGEGYTEARGVDGLERLSAFTPIPTAGGESFFVSIGIPTEIAYAASNRLLSTNLTWIGIAALLATAIAWFAGDVLFLRVVSLTAERDAAEGALKAANVELEARVEQRTAELSQSNRQLQVELENRRRMVEFLHGHEAEQSKLLMQLRQSNRDLQDFAYIASHDLQEPLRKVQAFSERLMKTYSDRLEEEGSDYLQRMSSAANRMQAMINDPLAYSRVASAGPVFTTVDLNRIAEDVISLLELRIRDTGGQVQVEKLPGLEADALQMQQLFQNLIGNSLKFHWPETPPMVRFSGEVLSKNGDPAYRQIKLVFEDNGIGFDEKYTDRIFKPFQRLHSREAYEGSGIGLALCRRIVERHHGQIDVASTPNVGSRFMITLPATHPNTE